MATWTGLPFIRPVSEALCAPPALGEVPALQHRVLVRPGLRVSGELCSAPLPIAAGTASPCVILLRARATRTVRWTGSSCSVLPAACSRMSQMAYPCVSARTDHGMRPVLGGMVFPLFTEVPARLPAGISFLTPVGGIRRLHAAKPACRRSRRQVAVWVSVAAYGFSLSVVSSRNASMMASISSCSMPNGCSL